MAKFIPADSAGMVTSIQIGSEMGSQELRVNGQVISFRSEKARDAVFYRVLEIWRAFGEFKPERDLKPPAPKKRER